MLAEAGGFEPPYGGIKIRRFLTLSPVRKRTGHGETARKGNAELACDGKLKERTDRVPLCVRVGPLFETIIIFQLNVVRVASRKGLEPLTPGLGSAISRC